MEKRQHGKGNVHPNERREYRDEVTGARVLQMTSHPSRSHLSYFLQSSFTPDSRNLIFVSYRTGEAQLFETGFPDGPVRQLTDGASIHAYSPTLSPDGATVFFVRGGGIWRLDRATLAEEQVVEFEGAQLGECTLGGGGEWLTAAYKRGTEQGLVAGRADGTEWRVIPFGRTVIHPQFHPLEPEWIEFAGDPAPRMYRVRRDGTGMECLRENPFEEWLTHETFLGTTGDMVFVHWRKALYRLNWRTLEAAPVTDYPVWHVSPSRDGQRILCDTNVPDEGLFEIDVATGRRRLICMPGASNGGTQWKESQPANWKSDAKSALSWLEVPLDQVYGPQWTHPHPCYSPDERWVTFTSDRTGEAQVYVVENTVTR
ncbi:MAG TPA: oligogalacturonate lyase family protein [Bryobacteraceae bacterium]|nr:hypothetical protein [Bryobacterales bacterium]HRJ20842.1 oligogalacturonate lyase family protein [Bryobacteraceae bacterium]